jgi:YHS domain-containing protein
MTKHIFGLSAAIVAGTAGLILMLSDIGSAGTYKLEYPAGYGCVCTPNWSNYGHFKTQWRQWPGEERLDLRHPKAIGAEPLPPVKGIEQLPLPRVKLQELAPPSETERPGEFNPTPGLPPEPGANPTPGLPPDPGFNPTPNMPPNLDNLLEKSKGSGDSPTTPPLKKDENFPGETPKNGKDILNPGVGGLRFKNETPNAIASREPSSNRHAEPGGSTSSMPTRLPDVATTKAAAEKLPTENQTRPQEKGNTRLPPGVYAETFRSGTIFPATEHARQANYQAPAESHKMPSSGEVVVQSYQQSDPSQWKFASAAPPIALRGFCPVELCRSGRWAQGDPRWTVIHKGFTYRLSGNEQRLQFLANPEQFVPANGGNDPVISATEQRDAPGDLTFCAAFKGRIYMFGDSATQMEFQRNPERYVGAK